MINQFIDSPTEIEKALETLTDSEQIAFNLGYIMALVNIVEQLRDSKIKLLNKIHSIEDSHLSEDNKRLQLIARLRILEIYDDHYSKRINTLAKNYTLSS